MSISLPFDSFTDMISTVSITSGFIVSTLGPLAGLYFLPRKKYDQDIADRAKSDEKARAEESDRQKSLRDEMKAHFELRLTEQNTKIIEMQQTITGGMGSMVDAMHKMDLRLARMEERTCRDRGSD